MSAWEPPVHSSFPPASFATLLTCPGGAATTFADNESAVGAPIVLECDANTAALAEYLLGPSSAYGLRSLCMLTLGTGVGNGLILDGSIWHGEHGMGGEAGHIAVDPNGPVCGCGNRGCLEQLASATAVRRMFVEAASPASDRLVAELLGAQTGFGAREIADLARLDVPVAKEVFRKVGVALGIALASLINTLDLRLYVLGGGLIGAWDLFSPAMFEEVEWRSYVYRIAANLYPKGVSDGHLDASSRRIRIEPARLGAASGIIGSAALPFHLHSEAALAH